MGNTEHLKLGFYPEQTLFVLDLFCMLRLVRRVEKNILRKIYKFYLYT